MKNLVSIILPNYNHFPYLRDRLHSIFTQSYQNFEVIILDDASTDNSLSVLNEYRSHPKVSHFVVNGKNSGSPFKQWKKGLSLAKGDYIWIAESDDFCEPSFLETQLQSMQGNDISVAKTVLFGAGKKEREIVHPAFRENGNITLNREHIMYCPILNVSAALFRKIDRDRLDAAVFDDFQIIGDRVFYHEFFYGKRWGYNSGTQSFFRQEEGNLSNLEAKGLNYLIRYFKEHVRFIDSITATDPTLLEFRKTYITRFFNRVRHRVPRKNKFSIPFLKLYIYYRFQLSK